jgi:hypothetical protein
MKDKTLTKDKLQKWFIEIWNDSGKELNSESPIGEVYPGCYHIGGGIHTGKAGWEMFQENLTKTYKEDV